jgi:alcohol dehydrogenase class IV
MMRFEFATASRIVFGPGVVKEVGGLVAKMGKHTLVVTGKAAADPSTLLQVLAENDLVYELFEVPGEPTLQLVEEGALLAREQKTQVVIGFGGGSSMDTAKAISAMATNPGVLLDYLEVIGSGKSISHQPLPVVAIPTTSGTGAEVTRNAVLTSHEHRMKLSLRSPMMIPRLAVVDPELTYSLPPSVTACTGMDALAQLIEPYVSSRHNPLVDAICLDGIRKVARSLIKAYEDPNDYIAREDMSLASLFGGLALANAGLGAVHGFASPIGGMFIAPHGAVCARMLAPVIAVNYQAISGQQHDRHDYRIPMDEILARYQDIARLLTGNEKAGINDAITWLERLCQSLNIPGLSEYGMTRGDIPDLVEKASVASSMQTNPIILNSLELQLIIEKAL